MNPTPSPLKCWECDYDLTGLVEHRCPECGTSFDPEELAKRYEYATRWESIDPLNVRYMKLLVLAVAVCCSASYSVRFVYETFGWWYRSLSPNYRPIDPIYRCLAFQIPVFLLLIAIVALLISFNRRMARERFRYRWRHTVYYGIWVFLIAGGGLHFISQVGLPGP